MIVEKYINMSGIYDGILGEIDCTDITGTNGYCDDEAKKILRERLAEVSLKGLHFLDSGNYHYLSYFFLEKMEKDFALVLFDHHPDYQPPSFGDILSCGGWVKNAYEEFDHLKKVYMVDVDENLFFDLKDMPKDVVYLKKDEAIPKDLPIYISIDKDVLSEEDVACDWDQGDMRLSELITFCRDFQSYEVLGVDVCGEKKNDPSDEEQEKNTHANELLRKCFDFVNMLC